MAENLNSVGLTIGLLLALAANLRDVASAAPTNTLFKVNGPGDIVWGDPTNEIRAGIQISHDYMQRHNNIWSPVQVAVFLARSGYPFKFANTNDPIFWGATNSFCGPIELRGPNGQSLPCLKPNVAFRGGYPDILDMKKMDEEFRRKIRRMLIMAFPTIPGNLGQEFLFDSDRSYIMGDFYLSDYFNLRQDVEYKLTVYPKVYRRSLTNANFYQRIDIPPVTVSVRWDQEH